MPRRPGSANVDVAELDVAAAERAMTGVVGRHARVGSVSSTSVMRSADTAARGT